MKLIVDWIAMIVFIMGFYGIFGFGFKIILTVIFEIFRRFIPHKLNNENTIDRVALLLTVILMFDDLDFIVNIIQGCIQVCGK